MAEPSKKLKKIRDLVKFLEGERQTHEDKDAKKISEYLLPHRGYWPSDAEDKTSILERGKKNINPAATLSLERAAGGLTVGMTPEGQPWFSLVTADKDVMEQNGVREHLAYRENLVNTVLRMGGFYQAVHVCNIELLGFGNMLLFEDTSTKTLARFETCTMGTYSVMLDSEGNLDTVVRRLRWSVSQIEKKYGKEKLSKKSLEFLEKEPHRKIDVIHVVRPREMRDAQKIDNLNMMYESVLYEDFESAEDDVTDILNESGYHEMPYFFAPYSRVGASDYGMGPGHLLIGHTRQLNETERQKIIALQKIITPPTKKPASLTGRLNVGPGQENAVSSSDPHGVGPLYEIPVQGYQYALQEIQDVMTRIAAVAKADLFYDLPTEMRPKDMTATEYMERKRERMQQIAPVVSIYEPQVLDKIIERTHNMLDRAGLFPPAPPALAESGRVEVEYVSSVAKSLRQVGAESTRALMLDVGSLAEMQMNAGMKPTALHKVDIAQAVDEIANGVGAPAKVVRDDDTFEKILEEEAAREEAAQKQQQEMEAMEQASKLGNVKTKDTVAGKIAEGVE